MEKCRNNKTRYYFRRERFWFCFFSVIHKTHKYIRAPMDRIHREIEFLNNLFLFSFILYQCFSIQSLYHFRNRKKKEENHFKYFWCLPFYCSHHIERIMSFHPYFDTISSSVAFIFIFVVCSSKLYWMEDISFWRNKKIK